MNEVWCIVECGDDYHGSRIMKFFYTCEQEARDESDRMEREQVPCKDCGFTYFYYVHKLIREENE